VALAGDFFSLEDMPQPGERGIIIGSTGGGKTGLATWMLRRFPVAPVVIYDTKSERKFEALPRAAVFTDWEVMAEATYDEELHYLIYRPGAFELHDPGLLDSYLMAHYDAFPGVPAYIDELTSFQSLGRPRPGLTALLTRGRDLGLTTLMATQRPAFISGYTLSESQNYYIFGLNRAKDRKSVADCVPGYDELGNPPRHQFYYWKTGSEDAPRLMLPVILDAGMDTGYSAAFSETRRATRVPVDGEVPLSSRHRWL
jgi:hypothetical protein